MAKSSKNAIGEFFKHHIEKFIFGMAILALGVLVFFSMKTEVYDKTPQKLASEGEAAKKYMDQADAWERIKGYRLAETEAPERIANSKKSPLMHDKYAYDRILGTRIASLGQRLDPELKAPIEMMAVQVSAPIVIAQPYDSMNELLASLDTGEEKDNKKGDDEFGGDDEQPGGGGSSEEEEVASSIPVSLQNTSLLNPVAQNWKSSSVSPIVRDSLCVLGLVPYESQWKEFDAKLRDSQGWFPLRDRPDYVHMEIQRREDGGEWSDVTAQIQNISANIYAPYTIQPEFSDPKYLHYILSHKIPPYLGVDFRQIAVHPKTELYSFFAKRVAPVSADTDTTTTKKDGDIFEMGGTEPKAGDDKMDNEIESRGGVNAGSTTQLGALGGGPKINGPAEIAAERLQDLPSSKYKLVRFFDPTVRQDVSYEYRVRVWIADPNNPSSGADASDFAGGNQMVAPESGGGNKMEAPSAGGASGAGASVGGEFERKGEGSGGGGLDGGGGGADQGGSLADIKFTPLRPAMIDPTVRDRIKGQENAAYVAELPFPELVNARATPWSEPTPAVKVRSVPANIFAGSATRRVGQYGGARIFTSDPVMNMVVSKFDKKYNVQMPTVREVFPGDLLNFQADSQFAHPLDWTLHKKNDVDFESDSVVVGIHGGERKSFYVGKQGERKFLVSREKVPYWTPGEILVLDRNGKMIVRNEFEDLDSYRKNIFEVDEEIYGKPAVKETDEDEDDDEEGGRRRGRGRGRGGNGGDDF